MPEGSTGSASCCRTSSRGVPCSELGAPGRLDRLSVEIDDPVDLRVPGIETLDLPPPGFAHLATQLRIAREPFHRVGEPGDQALAGIGGDKDAAAVVDIFRR